MPVNQIIMPAPQSRRMQRRPTHTWAVRQRPFVIQPICLAPVLPGETLKNASWQARVVSDPVLSPLTGWWLEYYWFYIKHRDLDERDAIVDMTLDPTADLTSILETSGPIAPWYTFDNAVPWTKMCLKRVVEEYFRDEGESWTVATDGGSPALPFAKVNLENWMDSLWRKDQLPTGDTLNDDTVAGGNNMAEVDVMQQQYEYLRSMKLINMTYEDYLATFGVKVQAPEKIHKPELLRMVRDWTYPSNTIDPTNGTPRSALSWSPAETISKDRYFKEPGFIFGCCIVRPKLHVHAQTGSAAGLMKSGLNWLPAVMREEPYTSLITVPASDGPVPVISDAEGYIVDIRDLFIYGDQFYSSRDATVAGTNTLLKNNFYAGPTNANPQAWKYPTLTEILGLFVSSDPTTGATRVFQDGIINFEILGALQDHT